MYTPQTHTQRHTPSHMLQVIKACEQQTTNLNLAGASRCRAPTDFATREIPAVSLCPATCLQSILTRRARKTAEVVTLDIKFSG